MLNIEVDKVSGIATLSPDQALSENDFESAARVIDRYIETTGRLNGLIISTKAFPGWESFFALVKHLQFVKNHHNKISHIAIVTDSALGDFAEHLASHFIAANIKHFVFADLAGARNWILASYNK